MGKKNDDEDDKKDKAPFVLVVIAGFFVAIVGIVLSVGKTLWLVSLVADSFNKLQISNVIPKVVDLDKISAAVKSVAGNLGPQAQAVIVDVNNFFIQSFSWLDLDGWLAGFKAWQCSGAKSVIVFFALLLLVFVVYATLKNELLFIIQIYWLRYRKRMGHATRLLWQGFLALIAAIVCYLLQLIVLLMYKVIVQTISSNQTDNIAGCSALDANVFRVFRVLTIISMVFVLFWYLQMMGGSNRPIPVKASVGAIVKLPFFCCCWPFQCKGMTEWRDRHGLKYNLLIHSAKRTIMLTFGYWNKEMVNNYDVLRVAAKYDDDETDKDTRHEQVVAIYGKSRGLLWMIIPCGVILTTMCQLLNSPLLFDNTNKQLDLYHPFSLRLVHFLFNTVRIIGTIVVVFYPTPTLLLILLLACIPPILLDFAYDVREAYKRRQEMRAREREGKKQETREEIRAQKHKKYANLARADVLYLVPLDDEEEREVTQALRFSMGGDNNEELNIALRDAPGAPVQRYSHGHDDPLLEDAPHRAAPRV